jgi:hypothetical protein
MTTPTNLKLDGLDFNQIKENFKLFLKSQSKFKDYNFEASGLNVLLDVLSYNTYYNSFYLNMISNEAFLSTAQRRNSIVAAAKSLNYTPRSITSARINVDITLQTTGTSNSNIILPAYTRFQASTDTGTYNFLNQEPVIFLNIGGEYTLTDLTLVEGTYVNEAFTKDVSDANQRFIISNETIDTSTLKVRVQNSSSDSTIRTFTLADSYVNVTSTSEVFFLEEVEDGKFEIKFGDDLFGAALVDGNIIILDYMVSSGAAGNDILSLTYFGTVSGVLNATVTVNSSGSYGGDEREAIDTIRFNAPKYYSNQNRLVTNEDYVAIMLQQPNIQSALVWGGEDNDPPQYGKVFIAAQPKTGDVLTEVEKENIKNFVIKPRKVITIDTEIVDPDYVYLLIDAIVKYDPNKVTLSSTDLTSIIIQNIMEYSQNNLGQFSKFFRYSNLGRVIDLSERSILSSTLSITMRKEIPIQLNTSKIYTIEFSNPINDITKDRPSGHPFSAGNKIISNEFTYAGFSNCYIEENGGIMRIYRKASGNLIGVVTNIGTVDYDTGKVILESFAPEAFSDGGTTLKLNAVPRDLDILPLRTQILTIRESDIKITLVNDNLISVTKR